MLKNWHKGTGGGPGLDIYFQSWSSDKLNKYDIDLNEYDHTLVANRPTIVFDNYVTDESKKLYLTIIHLWDDVTHNLLSSKFDPFNVEGGGGEVGIDLDSPEESCQPNDNTPVKTSASTRKRKYKKKTLPVKNDDESSSISSALKGVLSKLDSITASTTTPHSEQKLEARPLKDLYELMEQHKGHLKFLQEHDMCSENEKTEIINHVKDIYSVISKRSKTNKAVS